MDSSLAASLESCPCSSAFDEAYEWVGASQGLVPDGALVGGRDRGHDQYVGRAEHGGDVLPGKVFPEQKHCYVVHEGVEHAKDHYEVLCGKHFEWIAVSRNNIPADSVVGGRTKGGERLYIGRACQNETDAIGKVHPSRGACYVSHGGKEHEHVHYQILVSRVESEFAGCEAKWLNPQDGSFPEDAFRTGKTRIQNTYIGRTKVGSYVLPGEVNLANRRCTVTLRGKIYERKTFEVMCGEHFSWSVGSCGYIPPNAVPGGKTSKGKTLYIGRVFDNYVVQFGKVQKSHKLCYIPNNGGEEGHSKYQVLVKIQ